jgi:hypothetical protein
MDAFEILVIILSVFLGIFLILSIVIAVQALKLIRSLQEVAAKGGAIVDRVEEIGETFAKNAGAAGLLRLLMNFVTSATKRKRR